MIDLGFSAVAIADRVGHESIDITYRYSHLFPSKQVAMADKLDEVNAGFENNKAISDEVRVGVAEDKVIDKLDSNESKIVNIKKYFAC